MRRIEFFWDMVAFDAAFLYALLGAVEVGVRMFVDEDPVFGIRFYAEQSADSSRPFDDGYGFYLFRQQFVTIVAGSRPAVDADQRVASDSSGPVSLSFASAASFPGSSP